MIFGIICYGIMLVIFGVTLLIIIRKVRKTNKDFVRKGVKINSVGIYNMDLKWVKELYILYNIVGGSVFVKKLNIISFVGAIAIFLMLLFGAITGDI